jgi:hypothetical protein
MSHPRAIFWLIVGHLFIAHAGLVVAYFAGRSTTLTGAAFVGIIFSQLGLLGAWASLASGPWWKRLIGVVVGVSYLGLLLAIGIHDISSETFSIVVFTTTTVVIPLLIARFFRVVVQSDSSPTGFVRSVQFSIRDMLVVTFIVACLLSVAKWGRFDLALLRNVDDALAFGVTFGVVGVLPVWSVLATERPGLFSIGIVALGMLVGYYFPWFWASNAAIWTTVTTTEVMAVVVSLHVVRFCGYRLVRLDRSGATQRAST